MGISLMRYQKTSKTDTRETGKEGDPGPTVMPTQAGQLSNLFPGRVFI